MNEDDLAELRFLSGLMVLITKWRQLGDRPQATRNQIRMMFEDGPHQLFGRHGKWDVSQYLKTSISGGLIKEVGDAFLLTPFGIARLQELQSTFSAWQLS